VPRVRIGKACRYVDAIKRAAARWGKKKQTVWRRMDRVDRQTCKTVQPGGKKRGGKKKGTAVSLRDTLGRWPTELEEGERPNRRSKPFNINLRGHLRKGKEGET